MERRKALERIQEVEFKFSFKFQVCLKQRQSLTLSAADIA